MKGIRVSILKRFKSLQPFHSSIDHNTAPEKVSFRALQSHPSYKEHECRTREEFESGLQASKKGHTEPNSVLSIKDVIDYCHSPALDEAKDLLQECDEAALREENLDMEMYPLGDCQDLPSFEQKCPPGGSDSVVLYTTSLRGIRKTFEDCHSIKFLLDSFQVVYLERDVSMHLEFREELWEISGGRVIPPRLFIKGRNIGGADEVVSLHEHGELKNLLQGLPLVPCNHKCRGCNSVRFVLCCDCHGSRKVFHGDTRDGSFARCSSCNENGLIKCPLCS